MNIFEIYTVCTALVLVVVIYLAFRYMLHNIQYGLLDPTINQLTDVVLQQPLWTPNITYISQEDKYASEMAVTWVSDSEQAVLLHWSSEIGESGTIHEIIEIDPGNRMMGGVLHFECTYLVKFCSEAGCVIEDDSLTIEQRHSAERLYRLVHKFVHQLSL